MTHPNQSTAFLSARNRSARGVALLLAASMAASCSGAKWSRPGAWFSSENSRQERIVATAKGAPRQSARSKTTHSPNSLQLELYAERVGLDEANFERYVAKNSVMIVECGERKRGNPDVEWQQALPLSDRDESHLIELLKSVPVDALASLPASENDSSMFDGGSFKLSLKTGKAEKSAPLQVDTTLDVVSNRRTNTSRKLNAFYAYLRGISPKAPCGNLSFYGVGRNVR
jgi:hypothetical protein